MTIRLFENARQRTRNVLAALDRLGVLPANPAQRPHFLRPPRQNEALINRALSSLDRSIALSGRERVDAIRLNQALEPTASGNFTNIATSNAVDGVYTLNGSPCVIEDIIDLASPDASFDPALDVDAGGIKPRSGSGRVLPIKAPLLTDLLGSGFSAVFEGTFDAGITNLEIHCHDADYNIDAYVAVGRSNYDLNSVDFTEIFNGSGGVSDGIHKFAVTLTDTRMALSIDGGAAVSQESPAINGSVTAIQFNVGGDPDARLRSFAFYEVVADADLPALSAL